MQPILYYLLRATIAAALFYGFYKLLFSKTTFYVANRVALSVILVAIVVVPLFHYNLLPEKQPLVAPMMEMPIALDTSDFVMQEEPQPTPIPIEIPWEEILTAIYIGGVAFFLLRYIIGLTQLVQIIRTSHTRHTLSDGSILCITNKKMNPCSWFNYIILSAEDHSIENRAMIGHEQAHVHLRHSVDRLLFDLMACLFWFNPFAWLLRRELQSVHEFQADESVITEGIDAKTYQLLLIRKSVGDTKFAMANDFLQRDLQKRITMMMKNKTSTAKKWGYALALPLLVLIMVVLSVPKLNATIVEQQKDTVLTNELSLETTPDSIMIANIEDIDENSLIMENSNVVDNEELESRSNAEITVGSAKEIEAASQLVDSEEVTISGRVKSKNDFLAGVAIVIKGNTQGTVTDKDGRFSIKVKKGDVLSFSFIGYRTFEYKVAKTNDNVTVELEQEAITHPEVEVVAHSEDGEILSATIADKEVAISGRVNCDEGYQPGVIVRIKGTKRGTVTDFDGNFTIKAQKGDVLQFLYVGYQLYEFKVTKTDDKLVVELEEDVADTSDD